MEEATPFAHTWTDLQHSFRSGRLAHAYVIQAPPRGSGSVLARSLAKLVLCAEETAPCGACPACRRVEEGIHPDVMWIQPESKSRRISVQDQIRPFTSFLQKTAYEGGWKIGVVSSADRMTAEGANALLKTLEEPPSQCLMLLLTDAPQYLLTTILSRCQRLVLAGREDYSQHWWFDDLLTVLRTIPLEGTLEALACAGQFNRLFSEVKKKIEKELKREEGEDEKKFDARVRSRQIEVRQEMMFCLVQWYRDIWLTTLHTDPDLLYFKQESEIQHRAASLTSGQALRRLRNLDVLALRLDRSMKDSTAFAAAFLDI